jgi:DNA repair photolyase
MKTIVRKSLLYRTRVEYGDYSITHVSGCKHLCKYPCYARCLRRQSEEKWQDIAIVENALELLDREIPRHTDIREVYLSFSTDPFQYQVPEVGDLTLEILRKLNDAGIKSSVLTKGVYPFVPMKKLDRSLTRLGITLVGIDEGFRKKWEPGAAPLTERIAGLEILAAEGFKTWISIEPYFPPTILRQDIRYMLERVGWADKIIFGKANYSRLVNSYDREYGVGSLADFYRHNAAIVSQWCRDRGIEVHIKRGTVVPAPVG